MRYRWWGATMNDKIWLCESSYSPPSGIRHRTIGEGIPPSVQSVDCLARPDGHGQLCRFFHHFPIAIGRYEKGSPALKYVLGNTGSEQLQAARTQDDRVLPCRALELRCRRNPNRLEYDLGFFEKGGDGLADFKPIAHLYKSHIYQCAKYPNVTKEIQRRPPTTDTYSLPQSQEE